MPSLSVKNAVNLNTGVTYTQIANFIKQCGGYNHVSMVHVKVNPLGTLITGKITKPSLVPLHTPSHYPNGAPTPAQAKVQAQTYAVSNKVNPNYANPVPFGYTGKPHGVRMQLQNAMLYGLYINATKTFTNNLGVILSWGSKIGHSATKPICLWALLNGAYSRKGSNGGVWGGHFVTLQYSKKVIL